MIRQDQEISGGEAYQAGRDLIVSQGISPEQMSEIMIALAGQLGSFINKAEQTAEARYKEIREELIKEFAKPENEKRREVFSDPDYQFSIRDAHEQFARSGSRDLRDELVRLLVERAKRPTGSRISLILNDAIRTSGSLTFEDLSVLAAVFMIKAVSVKNPTSIDAVADRYENMLSPFIDNITNEPYSFEYLESLGCITIERVADHYPLDEHMHRNYGSLINQEINKDQLWSDLQKRSRSLRVLGELWPTAFYRQSMLTALGKALAHSALESKGVMDAPLDIWVK